MASANQSATSLSSSQVAISSSSEDPETVARMCEEASERMQLTADILLLQSGSEKPMATEPISPGNDSYTKSRDAIVANTKGLAISVKDLTKSLNQHDHAGVHQTVQRIADQVIILTEAATHAAYLTALTDVHCKPARPGVVDRYTFARAKQAIHMAYDKFKPENGAVNRDKTLQISRKFADNLALLTQGCKLAAENELIGKRDRAQFSDCAQCLQGVTAAFLASLKAFAASHSAEDRKRCLLFGRPILEAVDSVVEFASFPQFAGKPARLTQQGFELQTGILGGAMAVVSSSIQLVNTAKNLQVKDNPAQWQKIVNCSKAVADATKLLSSSVRDEACVSSRRS